MKASCSTRRYQFSEVIRHPTFPGLLVGRLPVAHQSRHTRLACTWRHCRPRSLAPIKEGKSTPHALRGSEIHVVFAAIDMPRLALRVDTPKRTCAPQRHTVRNCPACNAYKQAPSRYPTYVCSPPVLPFGTYIENHSFRASLEASNISTHGPWRAMLPNVPVAVASAVSTPAAAQMTRWDVGLGFVACRWNEEEVAWCV